MEPAGRQNDVAHGPNRIAFSYVRFSSRAQEQSASLVRQTGLSERYAKDHGLLLDDSLHLQDLGVSAYRGKNAKTGALAGFLEAIHSGRVRPGSLLLVENLDRLSRAELSESVALFLQIINAGIDIITLADSRVYTKGKLDMTNLIISIAVLSRGHEESSIKSFRVKDAYARKLAKARALNGKFRVTKMGPAWLKANDDGGWDVIEDRAQVVREIFRLCDEGYGKWRICGILNERGIPAFRGKKWNTSYVVRVLTSPAVVGTFRPGHWADGRHRYHAGQDIPNYFPAVIDNPDLFERCYRKFEGHQVPDKSDGRIHLLAGLVWCGHKGEKAVVWSNSKSEVRVNGFKQRYRYYYFLPASVPTNRNQPYGSWNIEYLERNFLLFCLAVDWPRIAQVGRAKPHNNWEKQLSELQERKADLRKQLNNLYEMVGKGFVHVAEQIKQREQAEQEIDVAVRKLLQDQHDEQESARALGQGMPAGESLMRKVLLGGGDEDARVRLREEIRKRVGRIDLYPLGYDLRSVIEDELHFPLKVAGKRRCYKVTFRNGAVRWVVPDGRKDTEVAIILDEPAGNQAGAEAGTIEFPGLPEKFELPANPEQRRGRKPREWAGPHKPKWSELTFLQSLSRAHRRQRQVQLDTISQRLLSWDYRTRAATPDEWQNLLIFSAAGGFVGGIKLALSKGADPRKGLDAPAGRTASAKSDAAYRWSRRRGEKLDCSQKNGFVLVHTPLQAAVASGIAECTRTLVEAGADLNDAVMWFCAIPHNALNSWRFESGLALAEIVARQSGGQIPKPEMRMWVLEAAKWLAKQPKSRIMKEARWEDLNKKLHSICDRWNLLQFVPKAAVRSVVPQTVTGLGLPV